jgi:hypothetical protein
VYFIIAVKEIVEKKRLENTAVKISTLTSNYKINLAWRLGVKTLLIYENKHERSE